MLWNSCCVILYVPSTIWSLFSSVQKSVCCFIILLLPKQLTDTHINNKSKTTNKEREQYTLLTSTESQPEKLRSESLAPQNVRVLGKGKVLDHRWGRELFLALSLVITFNWRRAPDNDLSKQAGSIGRQHSLFSCAQKWIRSHFKTGRVRSHLQPPLSNLAALLWQSLRTQVAHLQWG